MASDEIIDVNQVTKDGGEYIVKCPHCKRICGVEGSDMSQIRGEQYQDICGGWFQIGDSAKFVEDLDA